MKHWFTLALSVVLYPAFTYAQSVGIGTTTPAASAVLDLTSTTQGLLPPRLTTSQRNAISNPAQGLLVYQTDGTPGLYYYSGIAWVNATDGRIPDSSGSTNWNEVSTLAGVFNSYGNVNGLGANARFYNPTGIVVTATGVIYVADAANAVIRKVTPAGAVTTFAGSGNQYVADGTGTSASFYAPANLAIDAAGVLYVTDYSKIRKITPAGVVTTLANSFNFGLLHSIAVDGAGTVYVGDGDNGTIYKITPAEVVTTFATNATGYPEGLAVDATGTVYLACQFNNIIRKYTPAGVATTLAGSMYEGFVDGTGAAARFHEPSGIALDAMGNLLVADRYNRSIRKITPAGVVTTLAGKPSQHFADGPGATAGLEVPKCIAVAPDGKIYFTDLDGIRVIQ